MCIDVCIIIIIVPCLGVPLLLLVAMDFGGLLV